MSPASLVGSSGVAWPLLATCTTSPRHVLSLPSSSSSPWRTRVGCPSIINAALKTYPNAFAATNAIDTTPYPLSAGAGTFGDVFSATVDDWEDRRGSSGGGQGKGAGAAEPARARDGASRRPRGADLKEPRTFHDVVVKRVSGRALARSEIYIISRSHVPFSDHPTSSHDLPTRPAQALIVKHGAVAEGDKDLSVTKEGFGKVGGDIATPRELSISQLLGQKVGRRMRTSRGRGLGTRATGMKPTPHNAPFHPSSTYTSSRAV
jgi:hypothetical protein